MKRAYLTGGTSKLLDIPRFLTQNHRGERNVDLYHKMIRDLLGVRDVFSYGSGRTALYEILRGLEIGDGDEVILPGYTCIVIPAAIIRVGAHPVYVDIEEKTLNVNAQAVDAAITPRTRAIIAQHTFGIPCDLDSLQELAERHSVHLIEDCAHAIGAKYKGVYCGNFGSASFFSTQKSKMISTEEGGFVTTNSLVLSKRMRNSYLNLPYGNRERIRQSISRWMLFTVEQDPRLWYFAKYVEWQLHKYYGKSDLILNNIRTYDIEEFNDALKGIIREPVRLAPSLALIGTIQLQRLEKDIAHRIRLTHKLIEIADEYGWQVPEIDWKKTRPSFVRFPFLVDDRDKLQENLREIGIQTGTWLTHPIDPIGSDYEFCQYKVGSCPVAENVSTRILNLPIHSRIGDWTIQRLVEFLKGECNV